MAHVRFMSQIVSQPVSVHLQDQASRPRVKEPETVRPSKKSEFGSGSGVLGALNSAAFVHKPLSSNMQRLGSKMNIPSAIDTSGLVQFVPARMPTDKITTTIAGANHLLWLQHYAHAHLDHSRCISYQDFRTEAALLDGYPGLINTTHHGHFQKHL